MPQKSKKNKKKANVKRKTDSEADRGEQGKYAGKGLNVKSFENLSRHFNNEELQDIRSILKNKDLAFQNKVPLLIAAIILNKFELLQKFVQKGCNVNETGPNRTTPLMWAVKCKNVDIVNFLLLNGADASVKNDNGDNVLFMALENRLWDEQSFIALWNHIKNASCIDINFMSKHGRNMLHTTIRREWNEFLNMLILEKVNVNATNSNKVTPLMLASYFNNLSMVNTLLQTNADTLKEDANGCTALCYAISYIINKNVQMPHLVVDKLMGALRANGVTFKDYFEKQVDLILNAPIKQNKSGHPLPDTKACIIPYALRYAEGTLKTLLETNIFRKLAQVTEKYIDEPLQMIKFVTIINEILQYCERYFGTGLTEKQLLERFISDGAADACLLILKRYGRETIYNYDFNTTAFLPLLTIGVAQLEGRPWIHNNYSDVLPFYTRFQAMHSTEDVNDFHANRNNEKISKFTEMINKIKLERALYEHKSFNLEDDLITLELDVDSSNSQQIRETKTDHSAKEGRQEPKSNAKKMKRRAKALKAKIAKIKSADLTERLNQNGKRLLEQKCASDTSIIKKAVRCKKAEANNERDAEQSQPWQQHTAWEQLWLMENDNQPVMKEFNETISLLEKQIVTEFNDEIFNVDIHTKIELKKEATPRAEIVSLYPDWKNKDWSLSAGTTATIKGDDLELADKTINLFEFSERTPLDNEAHGDIGDLVTFTLNYLSWLLQKIFVTYQAYWDRERDREHLKNDQGDSREQYGRLNNIKIMIRKLEIEHIERVQAQFAKLMVHIKHHSEKHLFKCCKIIDRLENLFMNHKIRGKSLLVDTPIKIVKVNLDYDEIIGDFYEMDQEVPDSTYIANALSIKHKSFKDLRQDAVNINYLNYPSTENVDVLLQGHPDALYLQEVLALPPKQPPNPEKIRADKIQTMRNAYHLIPSILKLCDEDYEEIRKQEQAARQDKLLSVASTSRHKKRQTLQETLLAMPTVDDPNKLLEALEKTQNSCENQLHTEATSRWCSVIRSLQLMKNYNSLLNGDIRISPKDKEESHTISNGGNFSPVVLGLDTKDRPLAVKRIQKDKSVSKTMKDLLNPLLGLRNTNLLHYFTCNYEENDLVLATPLCEYNMGEYVMFMKQSPNMHMRLVDIVKQFLAGLRFLHDRVEPIVHGNLKPSNIFIDLNGIVRIAEFGMYKALYTLTVAPNTSIIWFSRETFNTFKETSSISCTCASDVQVAGMLIHFILTAGKHPYGESMQDILKNLERALPQLITTDVDLHDLISWMLLYEPSERPSINQVLSHVFFWSIERKWRFILACAGVSPHGSPLNIPLNELHLYINLIASKENIKGSWINITKNRFPNLKYSKEDQDSVTGLLRFVRSCIQNQVALRINGDYEFRNFILSAFPALPLSLYRILESSQWLNHRVLQPFTTVDSLSA